VRARRLSLRRAPVAGRSPCARAAAGDAVKTTDRQGQVAWLNLPPAQCARLREP
jgi:hypothetical protein